MSIHFSQTITMRSQDPDALVELAQEWDRVQATQDVTGYMEVRILADRKEPGRYLMIADFGTVDPDVDAAEEAARNNEREVTQQFADRFRAVCDGEPEWHDYDELYRTSFGPQV